MTIEPRRKNTGQTIEEYIGEMPIWLKDIGLGLGLIVDVGRHQYGLEGAPLIDFVRRVLTEIVRLGGRPRHIGSPLSPDRNIPLYYGEDERAIVEGVIADWTARGMPDCEWGEFWFISPETTAITMDANWYKPL